MGIRPGLDRIRALLRLSDIWHRSPWKSVHVAGTNGKGSVCAYTSAMLNAAGLRCGRFTSPHIFDRWDGICIEDRPVSKSTFLEIERYVRARNSQHKIDASEFELLTATAFETFSREKVDVAVIEAGMGGGTDATNVLERPLCAVITKIGLDHQNFLGDTIAEIAQHKAGIIKAGMTSVVDGSNNPEALDVIRRHANAVGATVRVDDWAANTEFLENLPPDANGFKANSSLAYHAVDIALPSLPVAREVRPIELLPSLQTAGLPARLQTISIQSISAREERVLLDGAHNPQAAAHLAQHVDSTLREAGLPVTWVIAMSHGKDYANFINRLVRETDQVVFTEFGPVEGMPWVLSATVDDLEETMRAPDTSRVSLHGKEPQISRALQSASLLASGGPLIITGSLYLAGDVLRSLRETQS